MPREQVNPVLDVLDSELRECFEVVELGITVLTRAADLACVHFLRAADAIQLACALIARGDETGDSPLTLVSSDLELNAAAAKEGLLVENPAQS